MRQHAVGAILAGFFGGVVGAVGGCNFIVGAGDYAVLDGSVGPGNDSGSDAVAKKDGPDAHGGRIGDPCTKTSECTHGLCNGEWCTEPCKTNAICGTNTLGNTSSCVPNSNDEFVCVPGCTTLVDCINYPGTICAQVDGGTAHVCTAESLDGSFDGGDGSLGVIGDPCDDDAQCGVGTCNGQWCQTSCLSTTDTSCGSNVFGSGFANDCLNLGDDNFECFPGCGSNFDCSFYSAATCQPVSDGGTEFVCSSTQGLLGDPCSGSFTPCETDGGLDETCNGQWCTVPCTGFGDNSTCSTPSSNGQANHCAPTATDAGTDAGFWCTPGCTTDDDCAPYLFAFTCGSADSGDNVCGN
jgi:hypothetical protein